jgi:hypothetical protein
MSLRGILLSCLITVSAPAWADQLPNFIPAHDFSGTYLMTGKGDVKTLAVEYGAGPRIARITPEGNAGYIIFDLDAHDAKMVLPPMHQYMDLPELAQQANLLQGAHGNPMPDETGAPARPQIQDLGPETVAGRRCEMTKVTDANDGKWSVICNTEDGIILEIKTSDGNDIVAQTISNAHVPMEDLRVPAGYSPFGMPGMPGGMSLPGGVTLPGGMSLPSGMSLPNGMTIPGTGTGQ